MPRVEIDPLPRGWRYMPPSEQAIDAPILCAAAPIMS